MAGAGGSFGDLEQSIWLAALGKHPGWNDHLDDIGVETPRLVSVKTAVYIDGIGGAIDAGVWEALGEGKRDEGFAHSFFWRAPDGMVVGRMWSSSDGKGRAKYPMIACAMCRGFPLSFMAGPVLDRLRKLEDECRATDSAAGVIAATDRVRGELRDLAGFAPRAEPGPIDAQPAAARLAAAEEQLGKDAVGVHRVLYEMERYWRAYLMVDGERTGSRSRSMEVRPQQIRVPAVEDSLAESWSVWARLLLHRVDPLTPLLFISRDDRPWLDIIAGDPGAGQLNCLQRTLEDLPYTTDIEYEIDEETASRTSRLIERAESGEVEELDPAVIDAPSERLAAFLKRPASAAGGSDAGADRRLLYGIIAAAAVLLVIVLIAVFTLGGGGGSGSNTSGSGGSGSSGTVGEGQEIAERRAAESRVPSEDRDPEPAVNAQRDSPAERAESTRESTPGPGGESHDVAAAAGAGSVGSGVLTEAERVDRFIKWCRLVEDWHGPFREAVRSAPGSLGPHVGGPVLDAFEAADAGEVELDPTIVAPGRISSIERLVFSPPEAVALGELDAETEAAIGVIEGIQRLLSAAAWPARAAYDEVVGLLDAGQIPHDIAGLGAALDSDDGGAAFAAATRLEALGPGMTEIASRGEKFSELVGRLRSSGANEQADCLASLPVGGAGEGEAWAASTADRLDELVELGEELVEAATGLDRVDPALLARVLAKAGADRCDGRASLRGWAAVMNDRSLYLLDEELDPRRALPDGETVAGLAGRIGSLGQDGVESAGALAAEREAVEKELAAVGRLGWNEGTRDEVERRAEALGRRYSALVDDLDAAEREHAYEAESYIAELGERDSISETGSAAIDAMWLGARDDAIGSFRGGGSVVELTRRIERVERRAGELEAAMPRPDLNLAEFGGAAERVARLIEGEREERIGNVGFDRDLAAAADEYARWSSALGEARGIATELRSALDGWVPASEAGYAGLIDAWGATWLGGRVPAGELDGRIAVLESGVLGASRDELAETLADDAVAPEVRWLAWRALAAADWPADVGEFRVDGAAVSAMRAALAAGEAGQRDQVVLDRAGLDRVGAELEAGLGSRWMAVAADAEGWDELADAAAAASEFGVEPSGLPAAMAYNMTVSDWKRRASAGEAPEADEVLAFVGPMFGEAEALPDDSARAWLGGLEDELSGRGDDRVDFSQIGPGRAGWESSASPTGRWVNYSFPRPGGQPIEIAFNLVEGAGSGPVYLAQTETPASVLLSVAVEGAYADDILALLESDWGARGDTREGPCVWSWGRRRTGGRGVQLNSSWTVRRLADGSSIYAPGLGGEPDGPSEDHPLQRVTPHAAAAISAVLGCRLPTQEEWLAAYNAAGRPGGGADWNLRDSAFETQRKHVATLVDLRSPPWPDLDVFRGSGESFPEGAGAVSNGWSDGFLWFRGVGDGADHEFKHLVGNVAEYVLAGAAPAGLMTDRPGDLRSAIGGIGQAVGGDGVFAVIGGSALSPPGIGAAQPRPFTQGRNPGGFADVGFRMAFSPGGPTPTRVIITEALNRAPYLRMD